jgi:hypothetical protein
MSPYAKQVSNGALAGDKQQSTQVDEKETKAAQE